MAQSNAQREVRATHFVDIPFVATPPGATVPQLAFIEAALNRANRLLTIFLDELAEEFNMTEKEASDLLCSCTMGKPGNEPAFAIVEDVCGKVPACVYFSRAMMARRRAH